MLKTGMVKYIYMTGNQKKLEEIVRNTELINYLSAIRKAEIPDAWLVGGALRNTVWKELYPDCDLRINDIDVPYFSSDLPIEANRKFQEKLESILPTEKWECDNQAWVHLYDDKDWHMPHAPYDSLEESMQDFWYSVNTIGVKLDKDNEIKILNPEALDDLFSGILRILPHQKDNYREWFIQKIEKITSRCSEIKVVR